MGADERLLETDLDTTAASARELAGTRAGGGGHVLTCARCGAESPAQFRHCPHCGEALGAPHPQPRERRVVTSLFCDLVGFTALSESFDPEDVDGVLHAYGQMARGIVETYGGVVEKFIGDAVVAVFGLPVAHEDDAERAVRAGLRIVAAGAGIVRPDGERIHLRVGVNTGEVVARLDVEAGSGEGFLTGDAVNVAARLQLVAPPGGVVVGETTHELTIAEFDYEELPPARVKGKAEPVPAWLARAPRARTGLRLASQYSTRFIGRDAELGELGSLFEQCVRTEAPRSALVVGEPGIGKSRLVAEFGALIDRRPEMVTWRTGGCLPYGEGVALWPLVEIVKADAGILDVDGPEEAAAKLQAVVREGPDATWLIGRLRPLLGLDSASSGREENFAAWRRFLRDIARRGPAILVFEDLHWADDALLEFLDEALRGITGVPLLLIATARPALFERSASGMDGGGFDRVIRLGEFGALEAEQLLAELAGVPELPPAVRDELLERCGGTPLFAEEYVRLLDERGQLVRDAGVLSLASGAGLPATSSLQALIAARLDTLVPESKAVLADAAVVGRTFWPGAVAALGGFERDGVDRRLDELVERRLVRRVHPSSVEGEPEFSFWHALTCDVAYGQLPRGTRARRHAAAAAWLEGAAGRRPDDLAEILAHHYSAALELARAAGERDLMAALPADVVRFSSLAGDRAMALDVAAAERHYARALALLPDSGLERSRLLVRWGRALLMTRRLAEASEALEEAVDGFKAAGDVRAAAAALRTWSVPLLHLDDPRHEGVADAAVEMLDGDEPSPELVFVLVGQAGDCAVAEDHRGTLRAAERALEVSSRLGIPESVEALAFRGGARCDLGDAGGLDDCRRALAAAEARGLAMEAANIACNLGVSVFGLEGPAAALAIHRAGLESARRRSMGFLVRAFHMQVLDDLLWTGEWEEALAEACRMVSELEEEANEFDLVLALGQEALLRAWTGDLAAAAALADALAGRIAETDQPVLAAVGLVPAAAVRAACGAAAEARDLLAACEAVPNVKGCSDFVCRLPESVRVALRLGDERLAEGLLRGVQSSLPLHEHALASAHARLDEARGCFERAAADGATAAAAWRDFGVPYEEAQALLGCGRCLTALGRACEAAPALTRAAEVFRRIGAVPALAEVDAVLQGSAGPVA